MSLEANTAGDVPVNESSSEQRPSTWREMRTSEDWWAVWLGGTLLAVCFLAVYLNRPADIDARAVRAEEQQQTVLRLKGSRDQLATRSSDKQHHEAVKAAEKLLKALKAEVAPSRLKNWLATPGSWSANPADAFVKSGRGSIATGLLGVLGLSVVLFGVGTACMGGSLARFADGFVVVFLLAALAFTLAGQEVIKYYNLEYALWALVVGLIVSNTVGTPAFVRPAVRTEFYIKTGLVVLGAEVLFNQLLTLGVPGIFVAWVVTPIVLVGTYIFGQKVLRMESRTLNMVISADMSVCGVSAAIATAAACRAKKEELSFAIGLSLTFTVIMMVAMPAFIKAVGMSEVLGGAWLGGTIDSTGAVAAAGGILGDTALHVAATVKMIQNILIGITAFGVAVYWVACVETNDTGRKPDAREIWYRFPKFVIGFVAASVAFSALYTALPYGTYMVDAMVDQSTKTLRGWFFCLAFVSIGLETKFSELGKYLKGGKAMTLYLCGQTFNLCLTLLMAWLMFEVVFRDSLAELMK